MKFTGKCCLRSALLCEYLLAPEHAFAAALNDSIKACRRLLYNKQVMTYRRFAVKGRIGIRSQPRHKGPMTRPNPVQNAPDGFVDRLE
jgi:hypothetical protein